MEVYVLRHFPVDLSSSICYGQLDVPLKQSIESSYISSFKRVDFEAVYCSPLQRCLETAKCLGFDKVKIDERLMELNFGLWEGRSWDDISLQEAEYWYKDFVNQAPPQGEAFIDMYARVHNFISDLVSQPYENVLIITHGGVMRCFLKFILEFPLENAFRTSISFGQQLHFSLYEDKNLNSLNFIA